MHPAASAGSRVCGKGLRPPGGAGRRSLRAKGKGRRWAQKEEGGFLLHTVYTILDDSPILVNKYFQKENSPCKSGEARKGWIDKDIHRL